MNIRNLLITSILAIVATGCATSTPTNGIESVKLKAKHPTVKYVRKNASSPEAADDLAALDVALKKMRQMGCEMPMSWYYQGAIHSVPNKVENQNPLCPSYINDTQLKWAWATCTHINGSELHFLIWHRLYIAHFEKIVRSLSGKLDFALPYWDYTNPSYRVMPAPFRDTNSSLFELSRLPSLNEGDAIAGEVVSKLDTKKLFENTVYSIFNSNIDAAPHGAMHVYIGGGLAGNTMWNPIYQNNDNFGLMTQVPSAGFDPIFWLHHSNIDYLWQKWENSANGARPELEDLEQRPWVYQFYDPDSNSIKGEGKRVVYTVAQAYEAAMHPDYVYDQLPSGVSAISSSKHIELTARYKAMEKVQVWAETVGKEFVDGRLVIAPSAAAESKSNLLKMQPAKTTALEVTLSFKDEPLALYKAYIIDSNGDRHLAGTLSFFGAKHHAGMHANHSSTTTKTFIFDVTDELEPGESFSLSIERELGSDMGISLEHMALYTY
ncbi:MULTISPECIES: tyrosinase family protein [Vibrio]|uniref:tyrosinase family protein n=1 Tax=Vibrio TaxID=662 RepID=UPI00097E393E|nr:MULTISPECIES: tyrosinase family protein [Vibrio]MBT2948366.1 tyrosinase family protein [Vibrio anguillarum]MDQ2166379.1 tyrosinase family protein [Vibrio anguillarum]NNN97783.1 tyrosinase family protein [Vibrio sp. B4-6]